MQSNLPSRAGTWRGESGALGELKDPATSLQEKMDTSFKAAYFLLFSSWLWAGLGWRKTAGGHGEEQYYHFFYEST